MHIGQRVKEIFCQLPKDKSVMWLASRLHCDRRNVYRIFNRDNIDIQLLNQLSVVLEHDFFLDLSNALNDTGICSNRTLNETNKDSIFK